MDTVGIQDISELKFLEAEASMAPVSLLMRAGYIVVNSGEMSRDRSGQDEDCLVDEAC